MDLLRVKLETIELRRVVSPGAQKILEKRDDKWDREALLKFIYAEKSKFGSYCPVVQYP